MWLVFGANFEYPWPPTWPIWAEATMSEDTHLNIKNMFITSELKDIQNERHIKHIQK